MIESERLVLRKHDMVNAELMFNYVNSDRVRLGEFLPWVKLTNSTEDEMNYIRTCHKNWDNFESYDYGIFLKSDNTYLDNMGIHCDADNVLSAKVPPRAGFKLEATLFQHTVDHHGKFRAR